MEAIPPIYTDNDIDIVKQLINHGTDVNTRYGSHDFTLLHMASFYNCVQIVKYLVEHGANVNQPDILKYTPLHEAARVNNIVIVKYLLSNGADPELCNGYGSSAADCAYDDDVAMLIRSYGIVPTKGVHCDS